MPRNYSFIVLIIQLGLMGVSSISEPVRRDILLNHNWLSVAGDSIDEQSGFEKQEFDVSEWRSVNVPHNWDQYEGYRRLQHGNRHGYAWYRKTFRLEDIQPRKRYFLFFEGVGSYATVYLNGTKVGEHAGGRTTFTIDVTDQISLTGSNLLAVRADHPPFIEDLPWVCGGCSNEVGFSEGSQPMGIFRPVHLIVTDPIRITPFGVHAWNDTTVSSSSAEIHISTEVKNYSDKPARIRVVNRLFDHHTQEVSVSESITRLTAKETKLIRKDLPTFKDVHLWSVDDPYLYNLTTEIYQNDRLVDRLETPYGVRWIKWDIGEGGTNRFYLNGKPVFINGTAEYEHNMGMSHAFSKEMVKARVGQIKAAGFNAFRDAHQPHNLRYQQEWDSLGVLWWPQMAAHIWYDTPEFRKNFKQLLRDWVRERRNSPSVILWGLENESTLPAEFARECTEIIREMDPTSPAQRLVTTCNGGTGTDWNVPQNWTGTYGGDPDQYHEDVQRQQLIGEYGAWRTLDLHTEGPFDQGGPLSEDRMTQLMEKKVLLADSVKDKTCGHFQWIFTSHENPGRNQSGEAFREVDRVGPVNYKGLFSPWGEPADVFYMFRANYAPKETEPMVYIVSHTWPNRWMRPGVKDSLAVYSNCEEVELFNGDRSLGRKQNPGRGRHFQWDEVSIEYNLLTAIGYVEGKEVARDDVTLFHLAEAPNLKDLIREDVGLSNDSDLNYLYRINCGGGDYLDSNGNLWMADVHRNSIKEWGSTSWTDGFNQMPAFYASQRRIFDPVFNTKDQKLFQTFRYGQQRLKFHFPVPDGEYSIQLHFIEPWYGTGGGMDCKNWRLFDVAINDKVVLNDLDIWSEAGHDQALIKEVKISVKGGKLVVHFPEVKSGQAILSAISIATTDFKIKSKPAGNGIFELGFEAAKYWLDWGDRLFADASATANYLPPELFGAEWIQMDQDQVKNGMAFKITQEADIYVALLTGTEVPDWISGFDKTKSRVVTAGELVREYEVYKKRFPKGAQFDFDGIPEADSQSYLVFANPAAKLEPPYDLKPKIPYDENVAILKTEGLVKEIKYDLGCVTFTESDRGIVDWPIKTGVADYHAIHFKYSNETGKAIEATFNLVSTDGTIMQSAPLQFTETPIGKYREITTFTETMINAGDYRVQVVAEGAKELSIRGIRVQ